MTLLKMLGITGALVAAFALTGGAALAHGNGKSPVKFFFTDPTVSIGANGNVLVRGAEVTGVAGDTITARTEWDDASITWTIDTDSDTEYVDRDGDEGDFEDMDEGDLVSFTGALTSSFGVDADTVREWPDEDDVSSDDNDDDDNGGKDHKGGKDGKDWQKPFINFWHSFKFGR